eukprot:TRINITY_DN7004_c0_g1_i1.p1 TRINITY_DN7004_c0_g1~~TRINITY_DN7004_c0_g1_i1.p1  ORF type:complete len:275 (+),score=99.30 TRINITY_DN7004_c0_g1_i1:36-827(+)
MVLILHSIDKNVKFDGSSIVLPSISLGNVGQLSVDLLISTFKFVKIGTLESRFISPICGNDPFSPLGSGEITTALELFKHPSKSIYALQQRSNVIKGFYRQFSEEVVNWIKQSSFKEVIHLHSINADYRNDSQLSENQCRFSLPQFEEGRITNGLQNPKNSFQIQRAKQLRWTSLESNSLFDSFTAGTTAYYFVEQCNIVDIPLVSLICFCSEGDNIPDAIRVSQFVSEYFDLSQEKKDWNLPHSWTALMEANEHIEEGGMIF